MQSMHAYPLRTLKSHSIHNALFFTQTGVRTDATHRNRQQKQKPSGRARSVYPGLLAQGYC
ncbi:hypothetical protein EMIT0P176_40018 [Pseudomonas sp. IT-P176]